MTPSTASTQILFPRRHRRSQLHLRAYVSNVAYWPHGEIYSYQLNNGLAYGATYNSRLQPTELDEAVGTNPTSSTFLLVSCPSWGLGSGPATGPYGACPLSTFSAQNNGNLQSVTASTATTPAASTSLSSVTQSFTYDGLNRIKTVVDNGSSKNLERDFSYDAHGNMWVTRSDANLLPTSVMPVPTAQIAYNTSNNNQFAARTGIAYDKAGNQTKIGTYSLTYDAENRQYSATNTSGSAPANYIYDGEGRRMEKQITGGVQTVYVYDAAGSLSAEYTTGANLSGCQTCYLSYDHLGSTRMVTNEIAQVIERHDYMPFGEEIPSGYSGRAALWGTTTGIVNQKFTGKERDSESGLDYFGARYYGSALGRFSSPDEPFADQHPEDPQSWNLYAYVRNNPLANIDPLGLDCISTSQSGNTLTVTTTRGGTASGCSGTFVDGTVNTDSLSYHNGGLSWSDNTASGGGAINFVSAATPTSNEDFGIAVVRSVGARTDASYQLLGTLAAASVATGASAALYDPALAAIQAYRAAQLAAAVKAAQEAWKRLPLEQRQAAMNWLSKITPRNPTPGPLPPGANIEALKAYRELAVKLIQADNDGVGTQALRVKAIDEAIGK